jgi:glycosyltransferase involved in cell wall biosynthesis
MSHKTKEYLNGINVSIKMERGAKTPKIVSLEELENKYTVCTNNEFLLSLSKDKKELIINTDNYVKSITDTNCNYLWETERDRTVMYLEEERTLYELYDGYSLYLRIWKILNKKQYQKYKNAIREREYALSADVVTAPSKIMFDYLKLNGVNTKIDVFPNPCQFNLATFTSKHNNHLVISYVNRIELKKGFDLFVELVETLKSNDQYKNQTEFICMGSFENWDGNPTFLLNKNINFHNHINSSDLMDLMINTNILVVPSRFESFSNVALEGMMCSCIVIVGKNVGIRDYIVNGVNGFIIDTDEKGALENCIKYIFSLTQYEQKMICQNAFNTACEISNYEFFVSVYERLAVKPAS